MTALATPPQTGQRPDVLQHLRERFGDGGSLVAEQHEDIRDGIPTQWVSRGGVRDVLRFLTCALAQPFRMLYILTARHSRTRTPPEGQPARRLRHGLHLTGWHPKVEPPPR